MKRIILAVLLATVLAVGIGVSSLYLGPGYVVFSYADYTVETSFVFMMGFTALAFFVFYILIRVTSRLLHFPNYMHQRHSERQSERSKNALVKGLIEMSEGRFEHAEKILLKHVNLSDTTLLNYLMAARAAQQQEAYDRRDEYLRLAHESMPSADIAIGITQAELQLSHQQYEQALATLKHLSSVAPKHGYVKKLLARAYQKLGDWESLSPVLNDVRKMKALKEEQLDKVEIQSYLGRLKSAVKRNDESSAEDVWAQVPKRLRSNPDLILMYVNHLTKHKKDNDAEVLIRNFLSHQWNAELALTYAKLTSDDCKKQLETAETWLHNQPRNAILLLVIGKLCLKCQLWGKARSYFESSIGIEPVAESYLELARLLEEKMDDPAEAQKMYQQGLMSAVKNQTEYKQIKLQLAEEKSVKPALKVIK